MPKYLDSNGLTHLWSKISMEDYPNNETLIAVINAIDEQKADKNEIPSLISQLENDSNFMSEEQVNVLFNTLKSDKTLRFYCIEDVTIIVNGVSTVYPANSNAEVKFLDTDVFEIVPTSNNSILQLNAFPGALGTYYPWLEGVKQFSNILFDMNNVDFYSKWSQGNQGVYQVQFAQYINCIFWSDNPYVSDVNKRTNYTLYYSAQLPLCYSNIPDNTFKAFFLAFGVNSDPNWGNKAYRDSFAKATWATQAFSYYGARTVGIFGHDDPDFNITLPKDCRGLMYDASAIVNAGTFDAINTTNFGAKSGSWRDAFGRCFSLQNLYIKNLKVNLNLSWSPISYEAISFIISTAANTNTITISVSPYTYYLLKDSDFELAASKNITIELLTTNYVEDRRLSEITNKVDKTEVSEILKQHFLVIETVRDGENYLLDGITFNELYDQFQLGNVNMVCHVDGTDYIPLLSVTASKIIFSGIYNATSVSLDFNTEGVGTLSTTYLCDRSSLTTHTSNNDIHITAEERTLWNGISNLEDYIYPNYLINATTLKTHYDIHQVDREFGLFKEYRFEVEKLVNVYEPSIARIEIQNQGALLGHFTSYSSTSADGLTTEQTFIFTSNNSEYNLKDKIYTGFDFKYYDANNNIIDISSYTIPCYVRFCEVTDSETILTLDEKLIPDTIARTSDIPQVVQSDWNEIDENNASYIKNKPELNSLPSCSEPNKMLVTDADSNVIWEEKLCYDILQEMTFLEEDVLYPSFGNTFEHYGYSIEQEFILGETYKVNLDGTVYECVAKYDDDMGYIYLGNGDLNGCAEGTNDPFVLFNLEPGVAAFCVLENPDGDHTLSVVGNGYAKKPINGDYIAGGLYKGSGANSIHTKENEADGMNAFAIGSGTKASGYASFAMGGHTEANGGYSVAEGQGTISNSQAQHVQGKYNIEDTEGQYAHIVGNGKREYGVTTRSNAHTLDWNGNAWFSGDIYINSTSGTKKDEGSKKLATEEYVDIRVPTWTDADEGKVLKIVNGIPTWANLINYITFTIGNYGEYTAEEGMTWEEWCSSKYNTYYWSLDNPSNSNSEITQADEWITDDSGTRVKGTDVIINNYVYLVTWDNAGEV